MARCDLDMHAGTTGCCRNPRDEIEELTRITFVIKIGRIHKNELCCR